MLKNNSRIETVKKEMDKIKEEGAKQEGMYFYCVEPTMEVKRYIIWFQ